MALSSLSKKEKKNVVEIRCLAILNLMAGVYVRGVGEDADSH